MKYISIEMTADELKALQKVERAGGGLVDKLLDAMYGPIISDDENDETEEDTDDAREGD